MPTTPEPRLSGPAFWGWLAISSNTRSDLLLIDDLRADIDPPTERARHSLLLGSAPNTDTIGFITEVPEAGAALQEGSEP